VVAVESELAGLVVGAGARDVFGLPVGHCEFELLVKGPGAFASAVRQHIFALAVEIVYFGVGGWTWHFLLLLPEPLRLVDD